MTTMDLRGPIRWFRAQALELVGSSGRERRHLDGSRAAVLMYHRVLPRAEAVRDGVEPGMYVAPETFARHLSWLETYFRVLPLQEIVVRLGAGQPLPPGACAITFDDGWRDNLTFAAPELERRGLPATVFVVSERVGTGGAFWPDEVFRRMQSLSRSEAKLLARRLGAEGSGGPSHSVIAHLKGLPGEERRAKLDALREATPPPPAHAPELLDWDELDRIATAGVDVESHGASHEILSGLPPEEAERELRSALGTLRERGHGRHGLLAYPNGGHDERVRRIAREVGYSAAVTTQRGLAEARRDPMAIPRIGLHDDVSRSRAEFLQRLPGPA